MTNTPVHMMKDVTVHILKDVYAYIIGDAYDYKYWNINILRPKEIKDYTCTVRISIE